MSELQKISVKNLFHNTVKSEFIGIKKQLLDSFYKKRFVEKWNTALLDIRFRCTNKCNENCDRCFERSGPNCALDILSPSDVKFYENEIKSEIPQFVWTGGEWSLIYDVDKDYMKKMFSGFDLSKAREHLIQTNCRWVFGKHREKILSDLKEIQAELGKVGKILKLDMSVDRYRSELSLKGVQELIRTIVSDGSFKNIKLRILSCSLDYGMTEEKVLNSDFSRNSGIKIHFEPRDYDNPFFQVCYANNTRIVIHEEMPTMRIGKAADKNFGYKIFHPERQCSGFCDGEVAMGLSFREDGMVKWQDYYDWDIMVPFKDIDGNNKPIVQIRTELINLAWKKRIKRVALDIVPFFNIARMLYEDREIKRTYEENQYKSR